MHEVRSIVSSTLEYRVIDYHQRGKTARRDSQSRLLSGKGDNHEKTIPVLPVRVDECFKYHPIITHIFRFQRQKDI